MSKKYSLYSGAVKPIIFQSFRKRKAHHLDELFFLKFTLSFF